ncbi:hypothetical protein [Lacisediminimonas profundi]|uniref:hypothetical protein n=1 Tax=Lacisediminimonas profundi TaxID=2603856 RepID=UPI00124BA46D|nr:hypothetical protein [Lacisediminimonas profundi]
MRRSAEHFPMQRGFAAVMMVALLMLLVLGIVKSTMTIQGGTVVDAENSVEMVKALFLAESGMERATQRYTSVGTACNALGETRTLTEAGSATTAGSFRVADATENPNFDTDFDGLSLGGGANGCRIRVTGITPSNRQRVIESVVVPYNANSKNNKATGGSTTTATFEHTVVAGENLLYIAAVSWVGASQMTAGFPKLNTTSMTAVTSRASDPAGPYNAQIFYLKNPTPGTYNVYVQFDTAVSDITFSNMDMAGVDLVSANPYDAYVSTNSSANKYIVGTLTPTTNGYLFDVMSRKKGGSSDSDVASCSGAANGNINTTTTSFYNSGNAASGYAGPTTAGVSTTTGYCGFNKAQPAAYQVVSIKASTAAGSGGKVRLPGGGIGRWREVTVPPS